MDISERTARGDAAPFPFRGATPTQLDARHIRPHIPSKSMTMQRAPTLQLATLPERSGRKLWKKFHYLTYAAAAAIFIHAILTDPELKTGTVDLLDGERILVEVCLLVVAAGVILRLKSRSPKRQVTPTTVAELPETES